MAGHAVAAQHFSGPSILECQFTDSADAPSSARVTWLRPDSGFGQGVVAAAGRAAQDLVEAAANEATPGESSTDRGLEDAARAAFASDKDFDHDPDPLLFATKVREAALEILMNSRYEFAGLVQHLQEHGEMPAAYMHPALVSLSAGSQSLDLPQGLIDRAATCEFGGV